MKTAVDLMATLALAEALAEVRQVLAHTTEWPAGPAHAAAALGRELVVLADAQLRPTQGVTGLELRRHAVAAAAHALRLAACITVDAMRAQARAEAFEGESL